MPANAATCATDGGTAKKFCPAGALGINSGACQIDCLGCTGFTAAGPATCATPNVTSCAADGDQNFCANTGLCSADCTDCTDSTAAPATHGQCVPANATTCATDGGADKNYCPAGASVNSNSCVASCSSCVGYTVEASTCAANESTCQADAGKVFCPLASTSSLAGTCQTDCTGCINWTVPGHTCQATGMPPSQTVCTNNGEKFCPSESASEQSGTCQADCTGCTNWTIPGHTCQADGTLPSETSCWANNGQKFCPAGARAQRNTCQDDCSGCADYTVMSSETGTCGGNACSAATGNLTLNATAIACQNNGTAGGTTGGCHCTCPYGFKGKFCEAVDCNVSPTEFCAYQFNGTGCQESHLLETVRIAQQPDTPGSCAVLTNSNRSDRTVACREDKEDGSVDRFDYFLMTVFKNDSTCSLGTGTPYWLRANVCVNLRNGKSVRYECQLPSAGPSPTATAQQTSTGVALDGDKGALSAAPQRRGGRLNCVMLRSLLSLVAGWTLYSVSFL